MNRGHERIEELLAVKALDGLDQDDETALVKEMAAHGDECSRCRGLETQYFEAALLLADDLEPASIRQGFEQEVMTRVAQERRAAPPDVAAGPRGRSPRTSIMLAAAASFVLLAAGFLIGVLVPQGEGGAPELEQASVVFFEGDTGDLALAYLPDEEGAYLFGRGLEVLPTDRAYEVWTIRDGSPAPGPCLRPEPDGSLRAFIDVPVGTAEAVAITVEPSSCSQTPTTEPILIADLTQA